MAPLPGTTRDAITQHVTIENIALSLTDTGGLFGHSEDPLHELVVERGRRALAAADLVVFVVDGREGLIPGDEDIAAAVRDTGAPVVLAVNKTDDRRARDGALELYRLGFDPVVEISAEHGTGIGDLMEAIVSRLPPGPRGAADSEARDEIAVAIVGRPNAGKSSLVNRLLREERMIVSPVPGTTRDAVDAVLTWHQRQFRIVDTAGIRRAGHVQRGGKVEELSVMLAKRAIEAADVVVLVIDAVAGATDQDGAIAGAALEAGRGLIVVANKWDLMKIEGQEGSKIWDEALRYRLKFLEFSPILHISAMTGERTPKLLETIDKVAASRRTRVGTGALNRFIEGITLAHPPVSAGRRNVRVYYAAQTSVAPPHFVLFTNVATTFHFSYMRYLENRLREEYGFEGSPIRITIRKRAESSERSKERKERRRPRQDT